jgi:AMP deaminase
MAAGKEGPGHLESLCLKTKFTMSDELIFMIEGLSQVLPSESSSPKLGTSASFYDRMSDGVEDYREDDDGGTRSHESWDEEEEEEEEEDGEKYMLPGAALISDGPPDPNGSPANAEEMLPRDVQRKTAYYDYAADKQLSQTDAKLFYQRSQLEAQKTGGSNWGNSQSSPHGSPVMMPPSFSNVFESEQAGMRRSGSMNSMKGGRNNVPV